jgi:hypothetical protein
MCLILVGDTASSAETNAHQCARKTGSGSYRKSGTPDTRYTRIADQYGVTVLFHKSLMTATETFATIAALVAAEPQFRSCRDHRLWRVH